MARDKIGIDVKDLMSSPVITVLKNETLKQISQIMSKNKFGSVVVTDENRELLGIVTERDIVTRVTALNLCPREVKAEDIMSYPVIKTAPDKDIKEAANLMNEHRIRRLVVVEKGKTIGIITTRDIFSQIVIG